MNNILKLGKVNFVSLPQDKLFADWNDYIKNSRKTYVCFCEAHLWTRANRDKAVADALNGADFVLPDGVGITLGARLCGKRFVERQPGPVTMLEFCRYGLDKKYKHFFYGGVEGIALQLKDKFEKAFPGIQITGTYCPPFRPLSDGEKQDVIQQINGSSADIVWVGLGAPKQELWMQEFRGCLNAPLLMGVGAAFDFHSNNRKWAPKWIRKMGLEWLFRILTGGFPIFKRYMKYLPIFAILMFKTALSSRLKFNKNTVGI